MEDRVDGSEGIGESEGEGVLEGSGELVKASGRSWVHDG